MSWRAWKIVLVVAAIAVVLQIAGFTLFSLGGSEPGSGEGEPLTGLTQTTP